MKGEHMGRWQNRMPGALKALKHDMWRVFGKAAPNFYALVGEAEEVIDKCREELAEIIKAQGTSDNVSPEQDTALCKKLKGALALFSVDLPEMPELPAEGE